MSTETMQKSEESLFALIGEMRESHSRLGQQIESFERLIESMTDTDSIASQVRLASPSLKELLREMCLSAEDDHSVSPITYESRFGRSIKSIAASCRTGLGKTLIECDTARIEHGSRLHIRPEHFESVRKGLGII